MKHQNWLVQSHVSPWLLPRLQGLHHRNPGLHIRRRAHPHPSGWGSAVRLSSTDLSSFLGSKKMGLDDTRGTPISGHLSEAMLK